MYRDSPWQEDASGPQQSTHSAATSTAQSDMDLIRRRLISAVQRPHAPSGAIGVITGTPARRHTTPSADPLSLRYSPLILQAREGKGRAHEYSIIAK